MKFIGNYKIYNKHNCFCDTSKFLFQNGVYFSSSTIFDKEGILFKKSFHNIKSHQFGMTCHVTKVQTQESIRKHNNFYDKN